MEQTRYVIVGEESVANLRLSTILKRGFGNSNVKRVLELTHLRDYLRQSSSHPVVICLDLFSYDLKLVTDAVADIRDEFPKAVVSLYLDKEEFRQRRHELPGEWAARFAHYYKLYREADDVEYEPIVRASLRGAEAEAVHNMGGHPVRLTPSVQKGLISHEPEPDLGRTVFVSYSRQDWDGFVQNFVNSLALGSQNIWLDQNYIVGGDDWMDAVGTALKECNTLLLVLSPEAMNSRYVKMEYRYFFNQEKPIIPILYKKVDDMPFELATLHYLDFTSGWQPEAFSKLQHLLKRHDGHGAT